MDFTALAYPAVILIAVASILLLAGRDWRLRVSALGVQFVGVFILVALFWPLELAVVKLVVGWISASVLGMGLGSPRNAIQDERQYRLGEIVFRVVAAGLVGLVVYSLVPLVERWLPAAARPQIMGGLLLIGMGLMQLGLSMQALRITIGLLSLLSGFEILYAAVEPSLLVAGMLAVTNMGIALLGVYLLLAPEMESEQ